MAAGSIEAGHDPLSILFVCQHDFGGATEKQALGFAQQLVQHGHRVAFTIGVRTGQDGARGAEYLDRMTLLEHRVVGRGIRPQDGAGMRELAPDIIHCLNPRAPTVAAATAAGAATGAAVLFHFEDDDWAFGERLAGEPIKTRVGHLARRFLSPLRPALWPHATAGTLRTIAREGRALDGLTPALAAEVTKRTGRPCSVLLPVTPRLASDSAPEIDLPPGFDRSPLAVFTGTLYPVYRADVEIGLRGVAELQRRGHELRYVHPGLVHDRIDPLRLVSAAGLREGTAFFPGPVPFAAIPPLLRHATVLLQPGAPTDFNRLRLPSKLQAYLESGTPTITFATGFGELLEDRREVLKTYTADHLELADRIEEALTDEQLRTQLSAGGPAAAARLFDPVANTDALERHYRAALAASA